MQRFLRSSILSLSVFAVSLSLAACGGDVTSETTTPGPTPAPDDGPKTPNESTGPSSTPRVPQKVGELDAPSNVAVPFHVYVSNQSFDLDPVDVDLFVDGKKVVTGDFRVEGQHTWIEFDFTIAVGEHTIRAVTQKGNVERTETIEIPSGEHWAVVNFWYSAKTQGGAEETAPSFGIDLYDEQPQFQ
jgi:hypothetical protein